MAPDYDIVIIGGGLVGATLAVACRHLPLKIALIDAKPFTTDKAASFDVRAVALAASSQRILQSLNLWDAVAHQACPINSVHVSDKGQFGFAHLHAQDYDLPAVGYVAAIPDLLDVLYAQLQQQTNIDLLIPETVKQLEADQQRAVLTLDSEQTITTALLIAADGGVSSNHEKLGLNKQTHDYQHVAVASTIGLARAHDNIAYERFTQDGPVALLPLSQQRCSLVWTMPKGAEKDVLAASDAEFLSRLQDHFGYRLGRFQRVGQRAAFPLHAVITDADANKPVICMGNAAHALHPIAGQGFNLSLRDIAVFVELLNTAIQTKQDWNSVNWRETYYQTRAREQKQVMQLVDGLAKNFIPRWLPLRLLRNSVLLALDFLPPAKRAFAKRSMGYFAENSLLASGVELI